MCNARYTWQEHTLITRTRHTETQCCRGHKTLTHMSGTHLGHTSLAHAQSMPENQIGTYTMHTTVSTLPGTTHKTPGDRHTHQTAPGRHPRPGPTSGATALSSQDGSACQVHTSDAHSRTQILGTQSWTPDAGHILSAQNARSRLWEHNARHATSGNTMLYIRLGTQN